MAEQIVKRSDIEAMARTAFERGDDRDSHGMNWHASALWTWLEEYDRCVAVAKADRELCGVDA